MFKSKVGALLTGLTAVIIFIILAYFYGGRIEPYFFQPTDSAARSGISIAKKSPETVVNRLTVPWELLFLPNGDQLITERSGTLRRVGKIHKSQSIADVYQTGESGLLGMALDPEFERNHFLYFYITTQKNGEIVNEVIRYTYSDEGNLSDKKIIFSPIPGSRFHNGGRIAFGPDGYLYITTGDAQSRDSAQDKNSLAGKILRISKDGHPAPDTPFNSAVYSYGHRNPQGLAWDSKGRLWATEHGEQGNDEVNLIEPGKNYGWPTLIGYETAMDMIPPVLTSGKNETWAPAGAAFTNGRLFFTGLRGQALYEAKIDGSSGKIKSFIAHYRKQYGRIRQVVLGPDGYLYFLTSNKDGRGWPEKEDDRILRIHPDELSNP